MPTRRLGLSFEVAPPQAVHPNRTDIAFFAGTVPRRRAASPVQRMPEVLAKWLESQHVKAAALPLRSRQVDLRSAATLRSSLAQGLAEGAQAQRIAALLLEVLDEVQQTQPAALRAFLTACRLLTPVPEQIVEDLRTRGFYPGAHLENSLEGWLRMQQLHDLPVVVEAFETFDALFAWEARPVLTLAPRDGDPQVATALGAALRAFFGEGGRRCYVVRSGDPVPLLASASERFGVLSGVDHRARRNRAGGAQPSAGHRPQLRDLRVAFGGAIEVLQKVEDEPPAPVTTDPALWSGLEHVFGLADVGMACLPDLHDAVAYRLNDEAPPPAPAGAPQEVFAECAETPLPPARPVGREIAPPRARDEGLHAWIVLVRRALAVLDNGGRAFGRRDVQLLASLPLPEPARSAPQPDGWITWMARQSGGESPWWRKDGESEAREPFSRLQVAWPWLVTSESADCPGGVEAPEGTLAGVLARQALARGAYRSAAFAPVRRYLGAEPAFNLTRAMQHTADTKAGPLAAADRLCLIAPTPRGPQLVSDVTFSPQRSWRAGSVRRLINVVVNAARRGGDDFAFESNGEALWGRVRQRLGDLGRELLAAGALSSDHGPAFVVRCGRDTMTQADLDNGRLIAEVELVPAQPVLRIVVVLALRAGQPEMALRAAA
jgi:hypothetical protein